MMTALHDNALFDALSSPPPCPVQVWRLGGAGIALHTGAGLLYIDPFLAPGSDPGWVRREPPIISRLPEAAVVLATHEHDDHADPVALAGLAQSPSCVFIGNVPSVERAQAAGFAPAQTRTIAVGGRVQHGVFTVTALPSVDPEIPAPMALLVEAEVAGRVWRLYHGGDTQMHAGFAEAGRAYSIDLCCLSVGAYANGMQYYLTPAEAVEAARLLRARVLIPVHWDLWAVNGLPESVWTEVSVPAEVNLVKLHPGEGWCVESGAAV
jgi:L-ascorbate metabolism protein UlaG (beta-lactamase superfamily)